MCAQDGPKLERCLNAASGGLIKLLKHQSGSWRLEAMCLLVHFRNRTQHLGVISFAAWASFSGDNWIFQVEGPLGLPFTSWGEYGDPCCNMGSRTVAPHLC